jgi:hypothetical protein
MVELAVLGQHVARSIKVVQPTCREFLDELTRGFFTVNRSLFDRCKEGWWPSSLRG